jgi:hypothetical protein
MNHSSCNTLSGPALIAENEEKTASGIAAREKSTPSLEPETG